MTYRFMRVLVFFDLPTLTPAERKEYSRFRKFLVKNGFLMVQYSVYSKLALNTTVAEAIMKKVRESKPTHGIVQMMTVTEKQYSKMEYLVGDRKTDVIDNEERLLIL